MKWPVATLAEVAPAEPSEIRFGPEEIVWHLTLDQIESNTNNIIDKRMAPASEIGSSTYVFDEGNVLYSKLRPYLNKVVRPREPGVATTELIPLRPRPEVLDADFLMYYLRSNRFLPFATQCVAGVKMPRIIMEKFRQHEMSLPPLSEQRRIVEILDQADTLQRKRATADSQADHILAALFHRMFGDHPLSARPTIQELIDEGSIILHKDGNYGSNYPRKSDFGDDGVLFLSATHLDKQGFVHFRDAPRLSEKIADTYTFGWVKNGDVLLAHNATVGRAGIVEEAIERMLVGTSLTCFRAEQNKIDPYYLLYALRSFEFQGQLEAVMGQGTRNQVPITAQRKLKVRVVPIDRQLNFSAQAKQIRRLLRCQEKGRATLEKLFATLSHRAFSGELTTRWREAHLTELLAEMEQQAKALEAA